MTVTRYLQIENIRFTYQELTQLCRFHPKNNFFTSLFYSSSFLTYSSTILRQSKLKMPTFSCSTNAQNTHFQRRLTFKLDFEVVLYVSNSILYSAQSQELFSALEDEFQLNKLIFLPKILILVSYSGEM